MSDFKEIRGYKFRVAAFSKMPFEKFKMLFEKQIPYKRLKQRDREPALREDFEKLTGKNSAEKKDKPKKTDAEIISKDQEKPYISESESEK